MSTSIISRVLFPTFQKRRYKYSESYLSVDYINIGDSYYSNQLEKLSSLDKIKTSKRIKVFNISRVQHISIFWFYLKFGKPMGSFLVKKNSRKIKILLYKMYLGGTKVKAEFHFYEKKLIYLKYIFPKLNKEKKEVIIDGLSQKYIDGRTLCPTDIYIVDSSNTIISFYDSYEFEMQYFTNIDFIKLIQKDKKKHKEKEHTDKQKQNRELLNKL